jgi:hypothetical protein
MLPLVVGTMAMSELIAPSLALSVETPGCLPPAAYRVRQRNDAEGTPWHSGLRGSWRRAAASCSGQSEPCRRQARDRYAYRTPGTE